MAYAGNAVYWVGQDGNVYLKSGTTVRNVGTPINLQDNGADTSGLSFEATRINDPNPIPNAPTSAPSNPTGGSGSGGTGPVYQDKSADISMQNAGLGAVDTKTTSGIQKIEDELGLILGNYGTESTNAESKYSSSSDQNQNNLQANKQTSLINAAQGRRGLFGTLSSLGALGGSGIELANRAVQNGANKDLSGAADNYAGNQSGLDTSIGDFRLANEERKKTTQSAASNAETATRNEGAKEKQGFYTNLANDYAAQGDTANAKKFTDMASALYGDIAGTAVPAAGPSYISAAFTPPSLSNYLVNGNTSVSTTPSQNGGLPGLIASNPFVNDKKKLVTA